MAEGGEGGNEGLMVGKTDDGPVVFVMLALLDEVPSSLLHDGRADEAEGEAETTTVMDRTERAGEDERGEFADDDDEDDAIGLSSARASCCCAGE